jgi:ABC-2 type transport system permease protein
MDPGDTNSEPYRERSAFALLAGVHLKQNWRRLEAVLLQSKLLSVTVLLFIVGYCWLSFALFYRAMRFVGAFPGLGDLLVERMIFILFAFLFALLLISNLVISYSNLFRNRETNFLHCLPISPNAIFQWKFLESTVVASWAFLFLIAPLLVAYGLVEDVDWTFYPVTVFMVLMFVILPAIAGAWSAIGLARYMDRRFFQYTTLGLGVLVLVALAFWLKPDVVTDDMLETRVMLVLDRLLKNTQFSQFAFLPSYWLASGVISWSEGAISATGFFMLVMLSYGLFWGRFTMVMAGSPLYEAASAVQSRGPVASRWKWVQWLDRGKKNRSKAWSPGFLERFFGLLFWMPPDFRAVLVKDVRVFWRDTSQWGQSLLLFGLLAAYIVNLKNFSSKLNNPFWIHLISYMNLGACSLNLATLTTRFVFPQFSLEGKRLWIVGMAPIGLKKVIGIKYTLACLISMSLTGILIFMSCHMLNMPWMQIGYFTFVIAVMALTLNGLAMGLGVIYPNFKEDNPSKIVSGFGGTFCLVLSFLYIVGSIAILAVGSPWREQTVPWVVALGWGSFTVLSLGLGLIPYRIGINRLRHMEI